MNLQSCWRMRKIQSLRKTGKWGRRFLLGSALLIFVSQLSCNVLPPATPTMTAQSPNPGTPIPSETPTPTMESPEGNQTVDELLSRCPSAEEIAEIDATISFRFENDQWPGESTATPPPPGDGPFGPLVCRREQGSANLDLVQRRVYQAFLIIRNLEFDAPLPWTDESLYEWLVDSIDGVRINPAFEIIGAGCCKPENYVVVSHAFWGQPDRWVDPEFVPPAPFLDFDPRKGLRPGGIYPFVVLLIHAARVNEVSGFNCSPYGESTDRGGEFGYDQKLEELGPWGPGHYFL